MFTGTRVRTAVFASTISLLCTVAAAQDLPVTVLAQFNGANGANPFLSGLIQASDMNFYGTTFQGGANGKGVLFRMTPAGDITVIHSFGDPTVAADGQSPSLGVIQADDGLLYGTTPKGGQLGSGVIFKVNLDGSGYGIVHAFNGESEGWAPTGLIQGTDFKLYGANSDGGPNCKPPYQPGCGTIFSVAKDGSNFQVLHAVTYDTVDAQRFSSPLVQASDGDFYGTSTQGGANFSGTAYRITPSGQFSLIYSVPKTDSTSAGTSLTGLIEGADGNFYGDAKPQRSGAAFFQLTKAGVYTQLFVFSSDSQSNADTPVVLASDGNYYGTNTFGVPVGGTPNFGTILKFTSTGQGSVLHTFTDTRTGGMPQAPVTQGADGNLYGMTAVSAQQGMVYRISPTPGIAGPVRLTAPTEPVAPGSTFTLSYQVLNAYSATLQMCSLRLLGSSQTGTNLTGTPTTASVQLTAPETAGIYTLVLTCGGQESGSASLTVGSANGKTPTHTDLGATQTLVLPGQSVTLNAIVSHAVGSDAPTGTVTLTSTGRTLGTATISSSGAATLTASSSGIAPGTYVVYANYSGDANYAASASPAVSVTVGKFATATALEALPATISSGQTCVLLATVTRPDGTYPSGGTVTFQSGSVVLGSAPVGTSGVAAFAASSAGVAPGTYGITATYSGDAFDSESTSGVANVSVQ